MRSTASQNEAVRLRQPLAACKQARHDSNLKIAERAQIAIMPGPSLSKVVTATVTGPGRAHQRHCGKSARLAVVVHLNSRFGEGFRTPAPCGGGCAGSGAGVRKPPKEETAGRKRRCFAGAIYGDLSVASGSNGLFGSGLATGGLGERGGSGPVRSPRRCGVTRWRLPEEERRPRTDMAVLLGRAAGRICDRCCEAESAAMIMRCRS